MRKIEWEGCRPGLPSPGLDDIVLNRAVVLLERYWIVERQFKVVDLFTAERLAAVTDPITFDHQLK